MLVFFCGIETTIAKNSARCGQNAKIYIFTFIEAIELKKETF